MSLTRPQQILLKRAQADAGIDDSDYRSALEQVTGFQGCRSSKDPRLTDGHLDNVLSFFEAIYWRLPDVTRKQSKIFSRPGYWADKNRRGNTSRDRHTSNGLDAEIRELEGQLRELGFGAGYAAAIRRRLAASPWAHRAALKRTVAAKRRQKPAAVDVPF